MKLLSLALLVTVLSCTYSSQKVNQLKYHYILINSYLTTNKPIPVLIFKDSTSVIKRPENEELFTTYLDARELSAIGTCCERNSDTFAITSRNQYPSTEITILKDTITTVRYMNNLKQIKIFSEIDSILKVNNLWKAVPAVESVQSRYSDLLQ